MGAATLITGVLAQLQKILNIQVPGFQIGAHGAFSFASLVNGYCGVVGDFQEGHDTLRATIGALDM